MVQLSLKASGAAMIGQVDQAEVFMQRMRDVGLSEWMPKMKTLGWDTYGSFAFCLGKDPSQIKDDEFAEQIMQAITDDPKHASKSKFYRLLYESFQLTVHETNLRQQSTLDGSRVMCGLSEAERHARTNLLASEIGPVFKIQGKTEPSDWLIDQLQDMQVKKSLRYLEWNVIGVRDDERAGVKTKKSLITGSDSRIYEKTETLPTPASFENEMRMIELLRRRGVALHVTRWLKFTTHELLIERYTEAMELDPPQGHHQVTMQQIMSTDREVLPSGAGLGSSRCEDSGSF